MAKNLIHIFGASGSGTTTLAEKISRELGFFHLDTGGPEIRSKAKHDQWQALLPCPILLLDGGDTLENNYQKVLRAIPKTERKCSL